MQPGSVPDETSGAGTTTGAMAVTEGTGTGNGEVTGSGTGTGSGTDTGSGTGTGAGTTDGDVTAGTLADVGAGIDGVGGGCAPGVLPVAMLGSGRRAGAVVGAGVAAPGAEPIGTVG